MDPLTPEQVAELQAKAAVQEEENRKLQANLLEAQNKNQQGNKSIEDQMAAMKAQSDKLTNENKQMKLDSARTEAIKQFPGAAPFVTSITGDSPEEINAKAKDFHEKASGIVTTAIKSKEEEFKAAWGNIPAGSTPNIFQQSTYDEGYAKATAMPSGTPRQLFDKLSAKFKLKLGKLANDMNAR